MVELTQPMTFEAANKWLKSRVQVPTGLGSRELALSKDFSTKVKAHSFFSAKVAEENVLSRLRSISDEFSAGNMNLAEARTAMKEFLYGDGVQPNDVSSQDKPPAGVSEESWKGAKEITNIASTARLNLVFSQNAAMANAVGQREVSMDPAVKERWPYFRYITGPNPRDEHAALDGLVLPKDDPFWSTHTPPWDYNCNCDIEDCDEEEAQEYGGISQAVQASDNSFKIDNNGKFANIADSQSGFLFDVTEAFKTTQEE